MEGESSIAILLLQQYRFYFFQRQSHPCRGKFQVQVGPTLFRLKTQCSSFITNLKWAMTNVSALEISHWANLLPLQHVSPLNRMADIHSTQSENFNFRVITAIIIEVGLERQREGSLKTFCNPWGDLQRRPICKFFRCFPLFELFTMSTIILVTCTMWKSSDKLHMRVKVWQVTGLFVTAVS